MVIALGHRGIHLVDRVALLIDRQRAVDAGVTLAFAEPRTGCIVRLVLRDGGLVAGIGILGNLDIECLRVLGEIILRLKLKNAGVGALIGINRIGMHSCIKLITGGSLDFYDLNITKRNAIKVQNALGICLSGRFPARS